MTTYLSLFLTSMGIFGITLIFPVLKQIREEEKDILSNQIDIFLTFCKKKWLISKSEILPTLNDEFKTHSISVWDSYKKEQLFKDLTKQKIALKNDPDRLGQIKNLNTTLTIGLFLYVLLVIFTSFTVNHYGQNTQIERVLLYQNFLFVAIWHLTLAFGVYQFGLGNKILDNLHPSRILPKSN